MRRGLLIFCSLIVLQSFQANAQFGNEWINYSWDYYKIKLNDDGIYRVSYDDLVNAGFPVSLVNPRRIKIFHRGFEQAIFVNGENDAQFNPGDYIEFYGIRNNGELDSLLYEPNSSQPHSFYNLYSDSSAYFLTWDKSNLSNGKRMDFYQESNTGGLPEEDYHLDETLIVQSSDYSLGVIIGDYVSRSAFVDGEGWTGPRIQEGNVSDLTITGLTSTYEVGTLPALQLILVGRNSQDHDVEILVGPDASSLRSLSSVSFSGFLNYTVDESLQWTDVSAGGELLVRISVNSNGTPLSNISVSSLKITLPQTLNMENNVEKYFQLIPNAGTKSFVKIINTPSSPVFYDVTDRNNVIRLGFSGSPNEIEAVIRNTNVSRRLFVSAPSFQTPEIKRVAFKNADPASTQYVIVSHPKLMKAAGEEQDAVKAYASYRASPAGGGYDTLVMSIRDLYDQFSYGEVSPLAIRNFMNWLIQGGEPEFLFLIGKALDINFAYYRNDPLSFSYGDLIPLGGQPGSDAIYTQGLNGSTYEPGVSTGRLTAYTPDDVLSYLEKVKEKEAATFSDFWQKRLLHLSGGKETYELALFENYVRGFEAIASNEFYGAKATTISKNTASAVEFVDISEEINNGVNLVTFFGHSAPGIIDIDVGVPSNPIYGYDNKGLYPTFFVNGCRSGDFFGDYVSWGADWVLTPEKGATAFIAHTYFGFSSTLKRYNDLFYEVGFADSTFIKKTLGEIHQETGRAFLEQSSSSDVNINQVQQMILIGDPATRLFGTNLSDFAISNTTIFVQPAEGEDQITSVSPTFDLGLIVDNYGAAYDDSLEVSVRRTLSNGLILELDTISFAAPFFSDTLFYPISNENSSVEGFNRFEIFINPARKLPELDFSNNLAIFGTNIPAGATTNLFPFKYAFLPNQNISLAVQSTDVLGGERVFAVELDTVSSFDSPALQSIVSTTQTLLRWTPDLDVSGADTLTYYWRSKFNDPKPGELDEWNESSFSVAESTPEGWAQLEFEQFSESSLNNMMADSINRIFEFNTTATQVFVRTFGSENPNFGNEDIEVEINGVPYLIERFCRDNTLALIAFDKSTSLPYAAIFESVLSPRMCGRQVQIINNFTTSDINGTGDYLNNYINAVGDGDQVILFNVGQVDFDTWSPETINNLSTLGIDPFIFGTDITPGDPFIVIGRKGDTPGSEEVILAELDPLNEQEITLNKQITGQFSEGSVTSSLIGPAVTWGSMYYEAKLSGSDNVNVDIIGLQNGVESVLASDIAPGSFPLDNINATLYPNIKLRINKTDAADLSAPQLSKWIVLYESPGEGILLLSGNDRNNSLRNSLIEGESLTSTFEFVNISNKTLGDSLRVTTSIFNFDSRESTEENFFISSPAPGDTTSFSRTIVTNGLIGENDYTVTVNSDQTVPELKLSNNQILLKSYLTVQRDDVNPVIEVVFDGITIFDGDIISPTPLITIEINDQNDFLLKEDTTGIDILINFPEEETSRRINFTDPAIEWSPASADSPFLINYSPEFDQNGMYKLSVQATDASGNKAGAEPWQINFEIVNESTITNFYPYPNPFSSSTRFVFTLTGRNIPDELKIQIMTISGKVVREITQDEIGILRIGNNMTEFAWDGRDEYGDQLANGVYLYRVLARIGGQEIDHRESAGDQGFKKGFGKIYLLR